MNLKRIYQRFFSTVAVVSMVGLKVALAGAISTSSLTGGLNSITTAVPFLNIAPDSRSQGMGDVGVATSPDVNSIMWNPSKLAFCDKPLGFAVSYTPWLRELVPDINLAYLSGYYKPDKNQAFGASLRYFSLGNIQFTDINGSNVGQFRPNEFALDGTYARKLTPDISGGLTARFIYSDLTNGYSAQGGNTHAGLGFAVDLSSYYQKPNVKVGGKKGLYSIGFDISNVGTKMSYTSSATRDFLPMNLRLGNSLNLILDEYNTFCFSLDFNKLLVPTPPLYNSSGQIVAGQDPNVGVAQGLFQSFTDAPGGFQEELREVTISYGMEYWYDKQFAMRGGFFYEDPTKGGRKFFTFGAGMKLSVFGLDFAYLVPTDQRNPLQNTLCFSLFFNFDALKAPEETTPKGE